jgi:YesN/AraC family two-component response regulator
LAIWREHRHKVDVVLTDVDMPGGVSGLKLAEILREENPSLQVVYLSGYSAEIMGKDLEFRDGINFLQKPYPSYKLARILREVLDR